MTHKGVSSFILKVQIFFITVLFNKLNPSKKIRWTTKEWRQDIFQILRLHLDKVTVILPISHFSTDKFRNHWYSRLEVFCRKSVLKNFAEFRGKHLCQGALFNKVVWSSYEHLFLQDTSGGCFWNHLVNHSLTFWNHFWNSLNSSPILLEAAHGKWRFLHKV